MGFEFALSPVLSLREVVEEREERLLLQIIQEIAATTESIDGVNADLAAADAVRRAELAKPSNGALLRAWYAHVEDLRQRRREFEQKVAKLEELREKQRQAYQTAHRDRQMLDEMRDREQATYDNMTARREQSSLDDSFAAQRARKDPHS
jgi:flagellar export protein FliJ